MERTYSRKRKPELKDNKMWVKFSEHVTDIFFKTHKNKKILVADQMHFSVAIQIYIN